MLGMAALACLAIAAFVAWMYPFTVAVGVGVWFAAHQIALLLGAERLDGFNHDLVLYWAPSLLAIASAALAGAADVTLGKANDIYWGVRHLTRLVLLFAAAFTVHFQLQYQRLPQNWADIGNSCHTVIPIVLGGVAVIIAHCVLIAVRDAGDS